MKHDGFRAIHLMFASRHDLRLAPRAPRVLVLCALVPASVAMVGANVRLRVVLIPLA